MGADGLDDEPLAGGGTAADDAEPVAGETGRRCLVLGCADCRQTLTATRSCAAHVLVWATVPVEDVTGRYRVRVHVCQGGHVVDCPGKIPLSELAQDAARRSREIEVGQTDVPFGDLDWRIPRPCVERTGEHRWT